MLKLASSSPVSGMSRRDFLGYCGTLAAMLGLGQAGVPAVAEAIEQMVKLPR
jgi:Ni,Fe-hydrogenase I small subunit